MSDFTPPSPGLAEPAALSIAGFDPSSGAGITADVLVFAAHGVFATAAITALTVQTTQGVHSVHPTDPNVFRATLLSLEEDLPPSGIKIGMLGTAELTVVVADYIQHVRSRRPLEVVLDPVLRSSSGARLNEDPKHAFDRLLHLVDAVTPNLDEAAALTGLPCTTEPQMEACAAALRRSYPQLNVVLTGGHLPQPADLLCTPESLRWFAGEHVRTSSTHGTGCALSSALVANRLQGKPWPQAVAEAKLYVAEALRRAVPRGRGRGPLALLPR